MKNMKDIYLTVTNCHSCYFNILNEVCALSSAVELNNFKKITLSKEEQEDNVADFCPLKKQNVVIELGNK